MQLKMKQSHSVIRGTGMARTEAELANAGRNSPRPETARKRDNKATAKRIYGEQPEDRAQRILEDYVPAKR
jgi:hypothetical protein